MARIIKGAADTPRNRIIIDLHRKGMSYNRISREIMRLGFDLSSQRCQQRQGEQTNDERIWNHRDKLAASNEA